MTLARVLSAIFVTTAGIALVPGCEQKPATEYVAGFSTQVQVPKQFKTIQYGVRAYSADSPVGVITDCGQAEVINGTARLPKTLGVHKIKSEAPSVEVTITAYEANLEKLIEGGIAGNCAADTGVGELRANGDIDASKNPYGARVLRRSQQSYRDGRVLYLPMPLKYACFDVKCAEADCKNPDPNLGACACVGGKCVRSKREERIFRDYSPELAFGDSSTCFSMNRCLADSVTPTVEDADNCIYSVPGTLEGMNVRAIFDGMITEVLDVDPAPESIPGYAEYSADIQAKIKEDLSEHEEGYSVVAPGKFRLAAGLCALTKTNDPKKHKIVALAASRSCPPKAPEQPLCEEGSDVLVPAPSRLYVLLDRSEPMKEFLGEAAINEILSLSLSDPVFTTTEIAFSWLPSKEAVTCDVPKDYSVPELAFDKTLVTRDKIIKEIVDQGGADRSPLASPVAALSSAPTNAYGALLKGRTRNQLNQLAVVLITNNDVGSSCAASPVANFQAEAATQSATGTLTYVIQIGQKGSTAVDNPDRLRRVDQCRALAIAGGTAHGDGDIKDCWDATEGSTEDETKKAKLASVSGEALNQIVSRLSSCVYEKPGSLTEGAKTTLRFVGLGGIKEVKFDSNCSRASEKSGSGWNFENDGALVRICGTSCDDLRAAIQATSGVAASAQSKITNKVVLPQTILVTATQSK